MPDPTQIAIAQENKLAELRDHISKIDPETASRLDGFYGLPISQTRGPEHALYVLEAVTALAAAVDRLVEDSKPRRRGRPRKDEQAA